MARPKKEKVEKEEIKKEEPVIDALGNEYVSVLGSESIKADKEKVLKSVEYAIPKLPSDLMADVKSYDFDDRDNYNVVSKSNNKIEKEDFISVSLERRFEKTSNLYEFLFLDKSGYMLDYIQSVSPIVKEVIKTFESSYPAVGFKEIKYKVNLID